MFVLRTTGSTFTANAAPPPSLGATRVHKGGFAVCNGLSHGRLTRPTSLVNVHVASAVEGCEFAGEVAVAHVHEHLEHAVTVGNFAPLPRTYLKQQSRSLRFRADVDKGRHQGRVG